MRVVEIEDSEDVEMREFYDFSKGVRGKYYERMTGRPLPIEIAPDLRAEFPDAESVNQALRRYLELTASGV